MKIAEIIDELTGVLKGKTLDAIVPPVIFLLVNIGFGIYAAIAVSIASALALGLRRLVNKQSIRYSLGGAAGVVLASFFAIVTQNVNNYFIAGAVRSGIYFILSLVSIFVGKPLAAIASHISRGWPMDWYYRDDVARAYVEVTFVWSLLFLVRGLIQVFLLIQGDTGKIVWANFLLGWPFNVAVLIMSYIYGMWRLKKLGGPGVDEFISNKEPPWTGQRKGF